MILSICINIDTFDSKRVNETWNNKLNISGYNETSNMRTNQRVGDVAILVKDCFEIKILGVLLKDTSVTKVLLDRSKFLLIISSYFPWSNKTTKLNKRWAQLLELIEKYSVSQNNMNIVIRCNFNKDISNDNSIKNQLQIINMKIV